MGNVLVFFYDICIFSSLCKLIHELRILWHKPLFWLQVIVVEESSQVTCPITTKLVLDEDEETKEPIVQVHKNLVTKLKPHQVDGTQRVWPAE